MSKLDDIVSSVDADWWIDGQASYEEGMDAQRELKEAIKTLFKELIGEDEAIEPDYYEETPEELVRNEYRKELRQKVDEL